MAPLGLKVGWRDWRRPVAVPCLGPSRNGAQDVWAVTKSGMEALGGPLFQEIWSQFHNGPRVCPQAALASPFDVLAGPRVASIARPGVAGWHPHSPLRARPAETRELGG